MQEKWFLSISIVLYKSTCSTSISDCYYWICFIQYLFHLRQRAIICVNMNLLHFNRAKKYNFPFPTPRNKMLFQRNSLLLPSNRIPLIKCKLSKLCSFDTCQWQLSKNWNTTFSTQKITCIPQHRKSLELWNTPKIIKHEPFSKTNAIIYIYYTLHYYTKKKHQQKHLKL